MKVLSLLWLTLGIASLYAALPPQTPVTYSEHIFPMIGQKCLPCHQPGGMGPFSLVTYEEVKKRSALFREVVMKRQMPPTDAYSYYTDMVKHPPLTDEEIVLVQEWVRQGLKEGLRISPPKPGRFMWSLGEPDVVASVSKPVKAEGNAYRETQVLRVDLAGKSGLVGFDVRPLNRPSVRFVRLGYRIVGSKETVFAASWAPGYFPWKTPAGVEVRLPPEAELVVEVLYQPTGRPEDGSVDLGLYFAKEPGRAAEIKTMGTKDFVLPKEEFTTLTQLWTLDKDIELFAVYPELRSLARQVKLTAYAPGQTPRTAFMVFTYDPNWIGSYVFEKPIRLPKGTRLQLEVQYDNTQHAFGDQQREAVDVRFGPKPTDELFWLHLQYVSVSPS